MFSSKALKVSFRDFNANTGEASGTNNVDSQSS